MNLVADIGNSLTKIGIFDNDELITVIKEESFDEKLLASLEKQYPITKIIISSVAVSKINPGSKGPSAGKIFTLGPDTRLPFTIKYSTPSTLGPDRLAGIAGAYNKLAGKNVLVIDLGTAVTFDLLEGDTYLGGNISPGLRTRFRALHHFTGKLPEVEASQLYPEIGTDTISAIRSGVQSGLIFEINEYIRSLNKKYKDLEVIITGGDASFFDSFIDGRHVHHPNLIIEGLNYILNYNVKTI